MGGSLLYETRASPFLIAPGAKRNLSLGLLFSRSGEIFLRSKSDKNIYLIIELAIQSRQLVRVYVFSVIVYLAGQEFLR